jgi:tetratricopeptide (TPR) repeat protein
MKQTLRVSLAIAGLLLARVAAGETHTPAEWVAMLGADHLSDREAAVAALRALGSEARGDVRGALNSPDPEVQARARELWKDMRWLVVPGADDDVRKLVKASESAPVNVQQWKEFVQKHGAATLRLVAEFHARNAAANDGNGSGQPAQFGGGRIVINGMAVQNNVIFARRAMAQNAQPVFNPGSGDAAGVVEVLEEAPVLDVARVIATTQSAKSRAALEALLDEVPASVASPKAALNRVQIETALWNYQQAFDYGREAWLHFASDDLVKACGVAADRGKLLAHAWVTGRRDVTGDTDPKTVCPKLTFYAALFSGAGHKREAESLCELAGQIDLTKAGDAPLQRLVSTLIEAKMQERAVKVLHLASTPEELYMRSAADLQIHNLPASDADWHDALTAINETEDARKKQTCFELGELMRAWHDPRAEAMWRMILQLPPTNTVFDANACLRLASIFEDRGEYAQAADLYEKGMTLATGLGGIMAASGPGTDGASGEDVVREKIKKLRAEAAGVTSDAPASPAPEASPAPQPPPAAQ